VDLQGECLPDFSCQYGLRSIFLMSTTRPPSGGNWQSPDLPNPSGSDPSTHHPEGWARVESSLSVSIGPRSGSPRPGTIPPEFLRV